MSGGGLTDIRNERIKLAATWVSNVGVGLFVVGAVTPLVNGNFSLPTLARGIIFGSVGYYLNRVARDRLGALR
jgi:hypothetical protein